MDNPHQRDETTDRIFKPSDIATCSMCGEEIHKFMQAFGLVGDKIYCLRNGCYLKAKIKTNKRWDV